MWQISLFVGAGSVTQDKIHSSVGYLRQVVEIFVVCCCDKSLSAANLKLIEMLKRQIHTYYEAQFWSLLLQNLNRSENLFTLFYFQFWV
jgi:hypothetical protein